MFNEINNYLKYINLFWNQLIGYFFFKYKNIKKLNKSKKQYISKVFCCGMTHTYKFLFS